MKGMLSPRPVEWYDESRAAPRSGIGLHPAEWKPIQQMSPQLLLIWTPITEKEASDEDSLRWS